MTDLVPASVRWAQPGDAAAVADHIARVVSTAGHKRIAFTGGSTPIKVLAPGRGSTVTGRLWNYVVDQRPWCGDRAPAALFRYSPDRKGERPQEHVVDDGEEGGLPQELESLTL